MHAHYFAGDPAGTCLAAVGFVRGGTGHRVSDFRSSICACAVFVASGQRFVVNPDPKLARATREGRRDPDVIDVPSLG